MDGNYIFIDTGAYLAHFHPRDQYHQKALEIWEWIESEELITVTTNHILDELATLLARRTSYHFSAMKIREIHLSGLIIHRPSQADEEAALELFEKYADQKISYTDCLSFVSMKRLTIKKSITKKTNSTLPNNQHSNSLKKS